MILYHILSKKRLQEKMDHAKANGGRLFITPHLVSMDMSSGAIPNYIHCLPFIVGAIPFAGNQDATIIKIRLNSNAKTWKYRGEQALVSFKDIAPGTDLIHTMYDNEKFFQWQEMFLASNENIESWTIDPVEIKADFLQQLEELKNGTIHQDHFFYRDFTAEEQYHIARLVGHHVGLEVLPSEEVKDLREKYDSAYQRIEAKYGL